MIAFVFPGQGSQYVGMGKSLAEAFPVCRATFEEADAALGEPLSQLCFEGPDDRLQRTENTQPAVLTVSVAAYRLLASRGFEPAFVAGHSLGEYSAHVAAGTIGFADALRTVRTRGRYMQEAVPVGTGGMAAVLGLDAARVTQACVEAADGEVVAPVNLNAPGQVVIAGARQAVARATDRARTLGARRVVELAVSAPFHCALMQPAADRLTPVLRALPVVDPRIPVVANVDAEPRRDGPSAVEALIRQIASPVRWEDVVRRLAFEGVRAYVEVGPGSILIGLVRKIERVARVCSFDQPERLPDVEAFFASRAAAG